MNVNFGLHAIVIVQNLNFITVVCLFYSIQYENKNKQQSHAAR